MFHRFWFGFWFSFWFSFCAVHAIVQDALEAAAALLSNALVGSLMFRDVLIHAPCGALKLSWETVEDTLLLFCAGFGCPKLSEEFDDRSIGALVQAVVAGAVFHEAGIRFRLVAKYAPCGALLLSRGTVDKTVQFFGIWFPFNSNRHDFGDLLLITTVLVLHKIIYTFIFFMLGK